MKKVLFLAVALSMVMGPAYGHQRNMDWQLNGGSVEVDQTTGAFTALSTVDAQGGFKDNGVAGIDKVLYEDGNVKTFSGGIIISYLDTPTPSPVPTVSPVPTLTPAKTPSPSPTTAITATPTAVPTVSPCGYALNIKSISEIEIGTSRASGLFGWQFVVKNTDDTQTLGTIADNIESFSVGTSLSTGEPVLLRVTSIDESIDIRAGDWISLSGIDGDDVAFYDKYYPPATTSDTDWYIDTAGNLIEVGDTNYCDVKSVGTPTPTVTPTPSVTPTVTPSITPTPTAVP